MPAIGVPAAAVLPGRDPGQDLQAPAPTWPPTPDSLPSHAAPAHRSAASTSPTAATKGSSTPCSPPPSPHCAPTPSPRPTTSANATKTNRLGPGRPRPGPPPHPDPARHDPQQHPLQPPTSHETTHHRLTHHIEAPPRWIARNRSRDHPRSRGVYFAGQDAINPPRGSSPLARGLRKTELAQMYARRIIPARAGFTGPGLRRRMPSRDHPRSRGVYSSTSPAIPKGKGSSPLARGLLLIIPVENTQSRIIPARAGFTNRRQ